MSERLVGVVVVVGVLLWSSCGGMVHPLVLGLVVVIPTWAGGRIISGIFWLFWE